MEKFLSLAVEKQNRIIDAALHHFGANGYKKASIGDIAAAAGISKAMVFHYFGTKRDLFLFLVKYCGDLIIQEVDDKFDLTLTDFFDRIICSSNIKLSVLNKHPDAITFLGRIYFENDEEVSTDIKTLLARGKEFRDKIAFDGMDSSKFKDDVNPQLVLKILIWMAEGFANSFKEKGFSSENLQEFMLEYTECMNLLKNNFYKKEYL